MRTIEDNAFLLLTIAISLAFAWILLPFYGAVLWGTVTAILFSPLHRRLLKSMRLWRNLAAFFTVMIIIAISVIGRITIAMMIMTVREAARLRRCPIDLNSRRCNGANNIAMTIPQRTAP